MFVQVIEGPVRSGSEALEMLERWQTELAPGAAGWLGTTAGVTDAGALIALVRFASEEDARRNSDRREQGTWWEEMAKRFSRPAIFHDCGDVALILEGGADDAGFVQVMESHGDGTITAADIADATSEAVRQHRPDVLGGVVAVSGDGSIFEAVYFTSEREAREAEAAPLPDEVVREMERMIERTGPLTYHDLSAPRLAS